MSSARRRMRRSRGPVPAERPARLAGTGPISDSSKGSRPVARRTREAEHLAARRFTDARKLKGPRSCSAAIVPRAPRRTAPKRPRPVARLAAPAATHVRPTHVPQARRPCEATSDGAEPTRCRHTLTTATPAAIVKHDVGRRADGEILDDGELERAALARCAATRSASA